MYAAQALLEGRGAHRGGGEHVRAGFDVRAVGTGAREVAMDEPHALEGDPIGERMKSWRAEGLEAVDEGVDAGGRGHRTRQPDGQFRVGYDDARHHLRVEDDLLLVRFLVENDAGAAHFRARARGGRDGDDRRDAGGVRARPPVADLLDNPPPGSLVPRAPPRPSPGL